jgi:hypothetical protein
MKQPEWRYVGERRFSQKRGNCATILEFSTGHLWLIEYGLSWRRLYLTSWVRTALASASQRTGGFADAGRHTLADAPTEPVGATRFLAFFPMPTGLVAFGRHSFVSPDCF